MGASIVENKNGSKYDLKKFFESNQENITFSQKTDP